MAEGCQNFGEYAHKLGLGIFNINHETLIEAGVDNWGAYSHATGTALFNTQHPTLVAAGCTNFGELAVVNKVGIYDEANAQVVHDGNAQGGVTSRDRGVGAVGIRRNQSKVLRMKMIAFLDKVCSYESVLFDCVVLFGTNDS